MPNGGISCYGCKHFQKVLLPTPELIIIFETNNKEIWNQIPSFSPTKSPKGFFKCEMKSGFEVINLGRNHLKNRAKRKPIFYENTPLTLWRIYPSYPVK